MVAGRNVVVLTGRFVTGNWVTGLLVGKGLEVTPCCSSELGVGTVSGPWGGGILCAAWSSRPC